MIPLPRFAAVGLLLLATACGSSSAAVSTETPAATSPSTHASVVSSTTSTTAAPVELAPGAFDATDGMLRSRVASAGLSGAFLRVTRAGEVVHSLQVGSIGASTPMSVASTSKWLTAATMMALVDDGAIALDDPIGRWLPEFASITPAITVRQLLAHTNGIADQDCLWSGAPLAGCVTELARARREFPAGSAYGYGNADYHVLGRLIEEVGGADFATIVEARITGPLAMTSTTWPGAPTAPGPAAGVRTTVEDIEHLLDMVLHHGRYRGVQVLSSAAVDQILTDQLAGYDTSGDFAVDITGIPRYGLGCWLDEVDGAGHVVVVSGNGGKGFYPWVDFSTNSYGVVGVQDDRGARVAVPASQRVAVAAREVLRGR